MCYLYTRAYSVTFNVDRSSVLTPVFREGSRCCEQFLCARLITKPQTIRKTTPERSVSCARLRTPTGPILGDDANNNHPTSVQQKTKKCAQKPYTRFKNIHPKKRRKRYKLAFCCADAAVNFRDALTPFACISSSSLSSSGLWRRIYRVATRACRRRVLV